jgi:glycosyltransferase involved in cell wall biosynthesis
MASDFVDKEIIVVDDGSTHENLSTIMNLGVTVLGLSENSGVAAARNYGASHARGEILFFVDADVVIHPDAIENVAIAFPQDCVRSDRRVWVL